MASLAYNNACAVWRSVGDDPERRFGLMLAKGDVEWSVIDNNDHPLPLQRNPGNSTDDRDGVFRIAGLEGTGYLLGFRNLSDRSYEVVTTVDGLDVLTGETGSLRNSGYLLRPREVLIVEGFRKSQNEIEAFRFAAPDPAYAADTGAGNARHTGVIGAALFEVE